MKHLVCVLTCLLLLCLPVFCLAATYVFPQDGFRYTQTDGETVLTQTNLEANEAFVRSLGTTREAVLANYKASGIVMEIVPENGGQIAVSVSRDAELGTDLESLGAEGRQALVERFAQSGLYDSVSELQGQMPCIRLTTSAMFASMPVYQLR